MGPCLGKIRGGSGDAKEENLNKEDGAQPSIKVTGAPEEKESSSTENATKEDQTKTHEQKPEENGGGSTGGGLSWFFIRPRERSLSLINIRVESNDNRSAKSGSDDVDSGDPKFGVEANLNDELEREAGLEPMTSMERSANAATMVDPLMVQNGSTNVVKPK